jgi:hypothetical protein
MKDVLSPMVLSSRGGVGDGTVHEHMISLAQRGRKPCEKVEKGSVVMIMGKKTSSPKKGVRTSFPQGTGVIHNLVHQPSVKLVDKWVGTAVCSPVYSL